MAGVPKFGDWDTGNQSNLFTAKFEEARSERGSGAAKQRFGRGDERLGYGVGRDNEEPRYGFDLADGRGGGRGKIMNPNDPLENPDAFFGNKAIKPKNMSQENNQHNHGFPVVNAQLQPARPSPARNVAPNLVASKNLLHRLLHLESTLVVYRPTEGVRYRRLDNGMRRSMMGFRLSS